jgi:hypothetical protein
MTFDISILVLTLLSLYLCVYLFINFNNFKNTVNFKIDDNVLLKDNTNVCSDIDNKINCQPLLTQNNLIKYDNYKNNLFQTNNALICKNVNNIETCTCLKSGCNYFKNLFDPIQYVKLINNLTTFSTSSGLYYTGRYLPTSSTNQFSLSFFINIHKIDVLNQRVLINWDNFKLSIMPYKTECSTKLYLQLYSLYEDGIFSNSCIPDIEYNDWNHFVITGKNDTIQYYFNGQPSDQVKLYKNYNLGNIDKYFIIGENCPGISVYNMYWFNDTLNPTQINYLYNDFDL